MQPGDEMSLDEESKELEFAEDDSENESVDHDNIDNSSTTNDNNSVTSYSTPLPHRQPLPSILLPHDHVKSSKKLLSNRS